MRWISTGRGCQLDGVALAGELVRRAAADLQAPRRPADAARSGPRSVRPPPRFPRAWARTRSGNSTTSPSMSSVGLCRPSRNVPTYRLGIRWTYSISRVAVADADHQHAGGQGVERAGVARLGRPRQSLHHIDGLARGHAGRLVQIQESAGRHGGHCRRCTGRRRGIARSPQSSPHGAIRQQSIRWGKHSCLPLWSRFPRQTGMSAPP